MSIIMDFARTASINRELAYEFSERVDPKFYGAEMLAHARLLLKQELLPKCLYANLFVFVERLLVINRFGSNKR
jgi:hypothetical protein